MNVCVFLDRDGTLNVDTGYPHRPEECAPIDGVAEALRTIRERGYLAIVVTNQSGIARGYYSEADLHAFDAELERRLDFRFDAVYWCPHGPDDDCGCRKPAPGMIERACAERGIDPGRSYFVGDSLSDMLAARAAGCRGIYV